MSESHQTAVDSRERATPPVTSTKPGRAAVVRPVNKLPPSALGHLAGRHVAYVRQARRTGDHADDATPDHAPMWPAGAGGAARVMIAAVDEWAFNERPAGVRFLTDRI